MSPPTTAGAEQSATRQTDERESEDECDASEVTQLLTRESRADARQKRQRGETRGLLENENGATYPSENDMDDFSVCQRLRRLLKRALNFYMDQYVLLVLTAVVGVSLNATCIKVLSANISPFQIVFVRASTSVMTLIVMSRWLDFSLVGPREKTLLMHLRGLFGASSFLMFAIATALLPLSEAAFLTNSYPVVTALLAWIFGLEYLGLLSWVGVFGCLVGNALIAHPPFLFGGHQEWGMTRVIGLGLAGTGNMALASTFVIIAHLGKSVDNLTLTWYMQLYSTFECIPFLIMGFPLPVCWNHSPLELLCYAGVTACGIPIQFLVQRAFQLGPPTKVTSILMTNMMLSGFIGVLLFSESVSWLSGVGAVVIAASVLTVTLQRKQKPEQYKALPLVDDGDMERIEMTRA